MALAPTPFLPDGSVSAPDGKAPVALPKRPPTWRDGDVDWSPPRSRSLWLSRTVRAATFWSIGIFGVGFLVACAMLGASLARTALAVLGVRL